MASLYQLQLFHCVSDALQSLNLSPGRLYITWSFLTSMCNHLFSLSPSMLLFDFFASSYMKPLTISFWLLISFCSQFYWLAMANTCVNPIIYYWMNARCCFKNKLNFHLLFQSKVSGLLWQGPFWLPATLTLGPEETKNLWGASWHSKDIE